MRIKTTREQRILYIKTTIRWILYYFLIFSGFVIMNSGTWYKPILVLPMALAVSMNNNQYASVLTGALCGFLIDISCGKLFGYNAVLLSVFCILTSLLFELYLKHKFLNYMMITAAASYIQCFLDYKFYYEMWGYANVERIFSQITLRVWIYTVISSVFIYLIFSLINHFLMPKTHFTIEEAISTRSQQNN